MNLTKFWHNTPRNNPEPGAGGGDPAPADPATPDPTAADPADPAPAEPAAPDLSFITSGYTGDDGNLDLEKLQSDWEKLNADAARNAENANLVPENGEYEFALPEDFEFGIEGLPEGFSVDLKTDDEAMKPLFGELGEMLQKLNAPADAAKQVTGLLAKYEAQKYSQYAEQAKAEAAKIGANEAQREARMNSLQRAIQGRLPKEQAEALMNATATYEGVRALETLLAPRGPSGTTPRTPSADLEKLSAYERLKLANSQQT